MDLWNVVWILLVKIGDSASELLEDDYLILSLYSPDVALASRQLVYSYIDQIKSRFDGQGGRIQHGLSLAAAMSHQALARRSKDSNILLMQGDKAAGDTVGGSDWTTLF